MKTLPTGLYPRLSKAEYLADPCERPSLSTSIAHTLLTTCPAVAWESHPRGGGRRSDPTAAMERGNGVEALLGVGDTDLVCLPGEMPNAKGLMQPTNDEFRLESAKQWKAEQEAAGKQVVRRADLDSWAASARVIASKLLERGIDISRAETQVTAVWEEAGGVLCRGRWDMAFLSRGVIYDLKVCEDVNPKALAAKFERFGYDIQRAAYVSGFEKLFPELAGRVTFEFIFAEPEPPYEIVICRADGKMRALGDYKWRRACEIWRNCLEANRWPGYADGVIEVSPAPWAMQEMVASGADLAEAA